MTSVLHIQLHFRWSCSSEPLSVLNSSWSLTYLFVMEVFHRGDMVLHGGRRGGDVDTTHSTVEHIHPAHVISLLQRWANKNGWPSSHNHIYVIICQFWALSTCPTFDVLIHHSTATPSHFEHHDLLGVVKSTTVNHHGPIKTILHTFHFFLNVWLNDVKGLGTIPGLKVE